MKTIIHDLDDLEIENSYVINHNIKSCIGCFSCWVKTPRKCIHKDKLQNISSMLLASDEVIIISKCINGCYSYKVKQILERCIGLVEPFFEIREGKIHHKSRTMKNIHLSVYFYGNTYKEDKLLATKLVEANAINFNMRIKQIKFYQNAEAIKEELI